MGAIIPTALVLLIRKELRIRDFVETGTFYGKTAIEMAKIFEKVWTIELSNELYSKTKEHYSKYYSNIEFILGDSTDVLPSILKKIRKPSIFWLDAHWSGGDTAKGKTECPILGEIRLIREDSVSHVILIDDARVFLAPPHQPHKVEDWPDIVSVTDVLRYPPPEPYIAVFDDVIVAVPKDLKKLIAHYWRAKLANRQPPSIRQQPASQDRLTILKTLFGVLR